MTIDENTYKGRHQWRQSYGVYQEFEGGRSLHGGWTRTDAGTLFFATPGAGLRVGDSTETTRLREGQNKAVAREPILKVVLAEGNASRWS